MTIKKQPVRKLIRVNINPFDDKTVRWKEAKFCTDLPDTALLEISQSAVSTDETFYKCGLIKFYPVYLSDVTDELAKMGTKDPITVFIQDNADDGFGDVIHAVTLYNPYTCLNNMLSTVYVINVILIDTSKEPK